MSTVEQLAQQALALAPADREYLVHVIGQSLGSGAFAAPEIAQVWSVEIDRRLDAFDRGELGSSDAETVLQAIGQRLEEHRRGKTSP